MAWLILLIGIAIVCYFWFHSRPTTSSQESTANIHARGKTQAPRKDLIGNIQGPGNFEFDVVGESHYQDALESIAGAKEDESKEHKCVAELVFDDDNPHDNQAVLVAIDGKKVGHLSRKHAREFRAELTRQGLNVRVCRVPARIVGGWKRGSDIGHFGVKLDLPLRD